MADLLPPPASGGGDFTVVPKDVYEAVILDVKEVPNNYWDGKFEGGKTQFEWSIAISEGEFQGKKYRYWTQPYISRKGNKFTRLVTAADPQYDIEVGYPGGVPELQERVIHAPVRITTDIQVKPYKKDDGTTEDREYSKITGFLPAKHTVDKDWLAAEVIKNQFGGTVVTSDGSEAP